MEENINKCHTDHCGNYCPFMEKPCEEVEQKICEAIGKAYNKGYENAYG